MHKLIMVAGILSLITLAAAGGTLGYWSYTAQDDAGFVRDYLFRMDEPERKQVRKFVATVDTAGEITDAALKDFLIDEELKRRFAKIENEQALEQILLANIAHERKSREQRQEDAQASLDRLAARASAYDAVRKQTDDLRRQAEDERREGDKTIKEWNRKQRDARLKQLITDLDKTRDPEGMLPQLQYLPLSDLYYVLTNAGKQANRAAIYALLPPETQRGLAKLGSDPAGIEG